MDEIGEKIVHAAYLVHKTLGPGLLEKVYEICFCHELFKMGLAVKRQIDIPIVYDEIIFEEEDENNVMMEMIEFASSVVFLKCGFRHSGFSALYHTPY